MPCFSKAWFMPFYFYERFMFVSLFTNWKKSKEDFSFYEKKINAPFLYIILIYEISIGTLYFQRAGETCAIFSVRKKQIYDLYFRK